MKQRSITLLVLLFHLHIWKTECLNKDSCITDEQLEYYLNKFLDVRFSKLYQHRLSDAPDFDVQTLVERVTNLENTLAHINNKYDNLKMEFKILKNSRVSLEIQETKSMNNSNSSQNSKEHSVVYTEETTHDVTLENEERKESDGQGKSGHLKPIPVIRRGTPTVLAHTPAFSADLKIELTGVAINQIVIFNNVKLNIGGHYDANNGIFTSPVSGIYAFHITLLVRLRKFVYADIFKNGISIAGTMASGTQSFDGAGSAMVVTSLNQGDRVWVKILHHSNNDASLVEYITAFTGYLVNKA